MRVRTNIKHALPGEIILALRHGCTHHCGGRETFRYTFILGTCKRVEAMTTYFDVSWRVHLTLYGPHVGLPDMEPRKGLDYCWHDEDLYIEYPGVQDLYDRIASRQLVKQALPVLEPYLIMRRDRYRHELSVNDDETVIPIGP